jgi:hypothetical protein
MNVELIPLLQTQRELYAIPRGRERFRTYLEIMIGGTDDVALLPLVAMNPMGKEHVAEMLDALVAFSAEDVAAAAVEEAMRRLAPADGHVRVGVVAVDDLKGGWTNRYFTEMGLRFQLRSAIKRGWATVACWTSEEWTPAKVREEVLASLYRFAYVQQRGLSKTLGEMMTQEGFAMAFAGMQQPTLDAEELDYAREVIRPHRDSTLATIALPCLFGDEAAHLVGYETLGLPPRAGFAVALEDALWSGITPEAMIFECVMQA